MKKIWIDGLEANVVQRLGSGQVAFQLIKNIEKFEKQNDYTILIPCPALVDMPKERPGFRYRILKPRPFWTRIALPLALFRAKEKPDVFFSPTHYGPKFSPVPKVIMIFDLAYLAFPQFFQKRDQMQLEKWTAESVKNAAHIITISEATKKDIIKYYGFDPKRITVCYPGKDETVYRPIVDREKIKQINEKYKIDSPYIIFVSTLQPRKNLLRLIEAFHKIEGLKLVVVGKTSGSGRQGWMYEEILNKPRQLGIEEKIIFTGFVPDSELPYLINGALAYIQPSLYEGFGIPVVEAMACGVPVLISNNSSLPEAAGDAGLTFDPTSVTQIEQAIRTVATDRKLRDRLAKKSLQQARKFSWKKMAKQVVKVLESI